jgi:hypothetical protein
MATRSSIGIVNQDGTVETVYCQWDGYPAYNGKILQEHYYTESKVRELLAHGDLSQLGKNITPPEGIEHSFKSCVPHTCLFYQRDRGDTGRESNKHVSISDAMAVVDGEWLYLFRLETAGMGYWTCRHLIAWDSSENRLEDVLEGQIAP